MKSIEGSEAVQWVQCVEGRPIRAVFVFYFFSPSHVFLLLCGVGGEWEPTMHGSLGLIFQVVGSYDIEIMDTNP